MIRHGSLGSNREILSARRVYEEMRLIETVERALLDLFTRGLVGGTIHTSLGQESCAVAVAGQLRNAHDYIFSNHRCHGHYLAFTGDVEGLIGEVLGKATGVCQGIGGSQHLNNGTFFSNGILGGIAPLATGAAFGLKVQQPGALAAVFLGDGAFGEGVVYESMNMASLWRLPVLFAVEDNGYAQSTPIHLEHAGSLADRARPFDIPVTVCDARNPMELVDAARDVIDRIREGAGPAVLYMRTYRLAPHSKGDDNRDPDEIERERGLQPLAGLNALVDDAERVAIDTAVAARVNAIVEAALMAPMAQAIPR